MKETLMDNLSIIIILQIAVLISVVVYIAMRRLK